ncbi:DnaJ domain protein [Ancylostoma caninum]|uniref:DnaJ domain protein n=1 Tax=Ancylostoma caninum TaxID=29170 RepID=A0A368FNU4_ANCCA|nr:DnaJ domain protein [Ancylostoma caninum]
MRCHYDVLEVPIDADDETIKKSYRNVFDSLANEDYDFIDDPSVRYPSFGDASSDYEKVVGPLYGFWSSFCAARSFAWLDKYDVRQANSRYELRQTEAEKRFW